jgi:C-terminal processing protease CtpA/Prc
MVYAHLVDKPFDYYQSLTAQRPGLSFAANVIEGGAGVSAGALDARADGTYHLRSHPNLGVQQPRQPTFKGKVIALINGGSFSTTAELLTHLHDKKRAVFVGEESAGAYHGNSSGRDAVLALPNSGLHIGIPLITYTLAVSSEHAVGRGVMPDYVIEPTIEDYLNGRDPQLEPALSLARSSP